MKTLFLAAAAMAALAASPAAAVELNFSDFSSTAGLQLNGDAAAANDGTRDVLRVTPALLGQSGSVFSTNAITLGADYSFSTRFTFNVNQQDDAFGGADGLVFVLQTNANSVGGGGGGIGYEGIPNSLGVEFDDFNNGSGDGDSGNHAGIDFNGDVNSAFLNTSLPFLLSSGSDLTAWIDYDGALGNLQVRLGNSLDRSAATLLFDQALTLDLGGTDAFAGFTSGTGSGWANHDVVSWTFRDTFEPVISTSVPEPANWALLIMGFGGMGAALRRRRAFAAA